MRKLHIASALAMAMLATPTLADVRVLNHGPGPATDFHMQMLRPGLTVPKSAPWGDGSFGEDRVWQWSGAAIAKGSSLTLLGVRLTDKTTLGTNLILDAYWTDATGRISNKYTLTNVPEPATWALLIAGFGITGVALRRRRMSVARSCS
ncbi:MAG: PEPxxWA-CTERM sorting domain-containing protein [Sphingomonadaceae bacterium]